ncbi:MAG: hypothetical protein OXC83_01390 [Chloroflexi bacterium]|nr:hypothetical protein [Chloroflexota bacterium]
MINQKRVAIFLALVALVVFVGALSRFGWGAEVGPEYHLFPYPPCIPFAGSTQNPCDPETIEFASTHGTLTGGGDGASITLENWITRNVVPAAATHIVFRGTYAPDTTRCTTYDDTYQAFHDFDSEIDYRVLICHTDIRVNEYIVGDGERDLTVGVFMFPFEKNWFPDETTDEFINNVEHHRSTISSIVESKEFVVMLQPSFLLELQGWIATGNFRLIQRDSSDVYVKTPFDGDAEVLLTDFQQRVAKAHDELVTTNEGRIGAADQLPRFIDDTNNLEEFFNAIGAYDHPTLIPLKPPIVEP